MSLNTSSKSFFEYHIKSLVIKRIYRGTSRSTSVDGASLSVSEINDLKQKISEFVIQEPPVIDDSELKTRKAQLQVELQDLEKRSNIQIQITGIETRVKELKDSEKKLSQSLADLERQEFTAAKFEHEKIQEVERRVNSMFKMVKFQMFTTQINGGLDPDCVCLVNGVPWIDANNAGKINAGLDIMSTLQGYYGIYAPAWVDNAEAVNECFPIASQLIRLVVNDKELQIK